MQILFLALVFLVTTGLALLLMLVLWPDKARQRLRALAEAGPGRTEPSRAWVQVAADLTRHLGQLAAPEEGFEKSSVKLKFVHAGLRHPSAPTAFFGIKAALTLGLPGFGVLVVLLGGHTLAGAKELFILLGLATLGYYGPNMVLNRMVQQRQTELFDSFPDALDLMTVCVEAGLGTEAAMLRVAEDMSHRSPVLSEEMRLVNLELRAGANRDRALRNFAFRTGVDEIDNFVTMLSQAERFGTSIATSLRIQSDVLRTRRKQKAEQAAAKISTKLMLPMMLCIFPALMIVIMGPAAIQMVRQVLPMMGGSN